MICTVLATVVNGGAIHCCYTWDTEIFVRFCLIKYIVALLLGIAVEAAKAPSHRKSIAESLKRLKNTPQLHYRLKYGNNIGHIVQVTCSHSENVCGILKLCSQSPYNRLLPFVLISPSVFNCFFYCTQSNCFFMQHIHHVRSASTTVGPYRWLDVRTAPSTGTIILKAVINFIATSRGFMQ